MIRLVIADDHAVVRQGISRVIALDDGIDLIDEVKDGASLLALLDTTAVDVVVTDMNMPGLSGVELIRTLKARFPSLAIVVFSMHNESQIASQAIKAGASGYLTKDSEPDVLLGAIHRCASGGNYVSADMASELLFNYANAQDTSPHEKLSEREFEIFLLLAKGMGVNEIGNQLHISAKTVSTHKSRLMQKMSMDSVSDLVRYALRHELISL